MYGLYHIIYFTIIDILKSMISPFFILINLIVFLQYSKFNDYPLKATIKSLVFGILGGLIASLIFIYLQVYIIPGEFLLIIILSIFLSFFNKRFICISYSGSILVIVSKFMDNLSLKSYEIMIVIAVLHIIESSLILLNYNNPWEINYYINKNRIVGGLVNNQFWPIPFTIFIGDILIRPITMIAILNYSDFTTSSYPRIKALETAILLFFYSSILFVLTILSINDYIGPIFAIIGHEFIIHFNKIRERFKKPLFTEPYKGIRVLKVHKASLAKKLGIRHGDIVLKINREEIGDQEDLRDIMLLNKGEVIIEYYNLKKGLVEKRYRGKEKALGIETFPKVDY